MNLTVSLPKRCSAKLGSRKCLKQVAIKLGPGKKNTVGLLYSKPNSMFFETFQEEGKADLQVSLLFKR